MIVKHVELYERHSVEAEINVEDIILDDYIPFDWRFIGLSEQARTAVMAYFNNDIDEAKYVATRLGNLYRHDKLPAWVLELRGIGQ